jgi:Alginate lyase/Immunoglobulin domain
VAAWIASGPAPSHWKESKPDCPLNWIGYGTHILDVQCKVLQVPSSGKVIIGQVKGYSGAALPLVKIQYESGTVYGYIKTNANNDASDKKYTYANAGLSNSITYQIKVVNGLVSVTVNGATNSLNVFTTDPNWATNTVYFKAGDYCQDNVGTTNEGARASFYSLTLSHAPAIINQPTNQIVTAGQNATSTVGASGNAPFSYQWWFNATNALTRATNLSLTITNAQSTNAGNYSVAVADSFGSVTSAVATLTVSAGPPPTLGITASGTNAIISWPSSTDSGYALQSTTNLASPTWSSAGAPVTIGNQNIVTNVLNWNAQFYRLKK